VLGQAAVEFMVLVAMVCVVIVGSQVYTARAVKGRLKGSAEVIGEQFSPRWSNFTQVTRTRQRVENTLSARGETRSTIVDEPAFTSTSGFVDDFSNRRLTDESLF
jgi:Flp pilus assembly pilin Flp